MIIVAKLAINGQRLRCFHHANYLKAEIYWPSLLIVQIQNEFICLVFI